MNNRIYVYSGDPKEYEAENEYDAARIFENGKITYMIIPELLDEKDIIYVIKNPEHLNDINEILKHGKIYHSNDFRTSCSNEEFFFKEKPLVINGMPMIYK